MGLHVVYLVFQTFKSFELLSYVQACASLSLAVTVQGKDSQKSQDVQSRCSFQGNTCKYILDFNLFAWTSWTLDMTHVAQEGKSLPGRLILPFSRPHLHLCSSMELEVQFWVGGN